MTEAPQNTVTVAGKSWTYIDVMASALACVDDSHFYADTEKWNSAWRQIIETPEARALLPEVHFASRDPYPAFSEQVEALVRTLSRASIISLGNPRYLFFTMDPDARVAIRRQNEALLNANRPAFDAMARILQEELVVPPAPKD